MPKRDVVIVDEVRTPGRHRTGCSTNVPPLPQERIGGAGTQGATGLRALATYVVGSMNRVRPSRDEISQT